MSSKVEEQVEATQLSEWEHRKLADFVLADLGPGGPGNVRLIQNYLLDALGNPAIGEAVKRESTEFDRGRLAGIMQALGFVEDLLTDYVERKYHGVDARKLDLKAIEQERDALMAVARSVELTIQMK